MANISTRTRWILLLCWLLPGVVLGHNKSVTAGTNREERTFSLFSIVSFPNLACTTTTSSTTYGTCVTSSECTTLGGSGDGSCAAGFGVCCLITTSTCGSTSSANTTYIRNPGYPSTITPSSTGSCIQKISKCSDDICQLRLDFETMSGYATSSTSVGACTDSFKAEGQTGRNPPSICGTNTGYHMYVEFGATSTDTISLTTTYGSTSSTLKWNILARQIACTASWKAPTDCTQYFTGTQGTIYSYNFEGGVFLQSQYYTNCIRSEDGYCTVRYAEKASTTPDAFSLPPNPSIGAQIKCPVAFISIPRHSYDGVTGMGVAGSQSVMEFGTNLCGKTFGGYISDPTSIGPTTLATQQRPFVLGVWSDTSTAGSTSQTGFALDYNHVAC